MALMLLAGTAAISVGLEPQGSIAAESDDFGAQTPQTGPSASKRAGLQFGELYIAYAQHPAPSAPCWSVHSLSGEILGIFADEASLKTFFPQVDTAAVKAAATPIH